MIKEKVKYLSFKFWISKKALDRETKQQAKY